jgi:hypothetical protein
MPYLLILKKAEQEDSNCLWFNDNIAEPVIPNVEKRLGLQKVITRPDLSISRGDG